MMCLEGTPFRHWEDAGENVERVVGLVERSVMEEHRRDERVIAAVDGTIQIDQCLAIVFL